jgi:hypothetical protein
MKNLSERLGFHRDAVLPEVPDGMALVKFHGEPAVIPGQKDGDEVYGKTQFTEGQIYALYDLEVQRMTSIREELAQQPMSRGIYFE